MIHRDQTFKDREQYLRKKYKINRESKSSDPNFFPEEEKKSTAEDLGRVTQMEIF